VSSESDNGCYVNLPGARAVAARALDLSLPLATLHAAPGALVSFTVAVSRATPGGLTAVERHPDRHAIDAAIPDADFAARHWNA